MSTIVVVKKNGEVAMAADTQTTNGGTKLSAGFKSQKEKILRFEDTYIGFVGYCAHRDVFESLMEKRPGDLNFRSRRHIFETFLKLHPVLKEDFFINSKEDDGAYETSQMTILIANPHGIFEVNSDRNVTEIEAFWAVGSGREYALGAMHQAYDTRATAREVAIGGVLAACEFDLYSGLPHTVYSTSLKPIKGVAVAADEVVCI
jgi:ATP-dependent HslUV protease, peptidase subunit HslV